MEDDCTMAQNSVSEARSRSSRSLEQENYALLEVEEAAREEGLEESPRQLGGYDMGNDRTIRRDTRPADGGGGVLQFFECDEVTPSASRSLLLPRVSASNIFTTASQAQQAEVQTPRTASASTQQQDVNRPLPEARSKSRRHSSKSQSQLESTTIIEMKNLSEDVTEPLNLAVSTPSMQGDERNCFICLVEGDKDNPLIPCCSTCFARTHIRCWREWRHNQQRTALRCRLLGQRNAQASHMLRCTICKSGTAMVDGEENGLNWMNELMGSGEPNENSILGRLVALGNRRADSDEDPDAQLEELVDTPTCVALLSCLCIFVGVLVAACVLIIMQRFYAGDIVLVCIIGLYELSVLQLVILAVVRRRGAMLASAAVSSADPTGAESNVREIAMTEV